MRPSIAFFAVIFASIATVYGKYPDDKQLNYGTAPITVGGNDADPQIGFPLCYDPRNQGYLSSLTAGYAETDRTNNNRPVLDARDGLAAKFNAFGMEAQLGGPGARLSYAPGPLSGQAITDARLLALSVRTYADLETLDNVTKDLRATRVWELGEGKPMTTAGVYDARQDIRMFWNFTSTLQDLAEGGSNAPTNINTATGISVTDTGMLAYDFAIGRPFSIYHLDRQKQAAEATLEVTRTGDETSQPEVGASAQWTSASRENVTGSSTETSRQTSSGSADCITVTDVVIIEGEETRTEKRMCRTPGSARHLILF